MDPMKNRNVVEVVLVKRHVEGLIADRVTQPVVQSEVRAHIPRILTVKRITIGVKVYFRSAETLLMN